MAISHFMLFTDAENMRIVMSAVCATKHFLVRRPYKSITALTPVKDLFNVLSWAAEGFLSQQ